MKINKSFGIGIIGGLAIIVVGIIVVVILKTQPTGATNADLSAKLSEILGVVQVKDDPQSIFNQVNNGFILNAIMQLQTMEESRVRLDLSSGSIIRLGQKTLFSLETPSSSGTNALSNIELQVGRIWIALKGGSLDVNTPRGIASVRGSYMSVWVKSNSNEIIVCCLEGSCTYQNAGGTVNLTTGQKVISTDMSITPALQPMDQADLQDWRDNSPESSAIVPQVAPLVMTSTPTILPAVLSTVMPEATPAILTTPGSTDVAGLDSALEQLCLSFGYTAENMSTCVTNLKTTPFPGFDPAMVQQCLSYGYASEEMLNCFIHLVETITPWIISP